MRKYQLIHHVIRIKLLLDLKFIVAISSVLELLYVVEGIRAQ